MPTELPLRDFSVSLLCQNRLNLHSRSSSNVFLVFPGIPHYNNSHSLITFSKLLGNDIVGFRFRRSLKIAPGIRINFGKKSPSLSFGVRGAGITVGSRGVYGNVGIPGTGLSYRTKLDSSNRSTNSDSSVNRSANSGNPGRKRQVKAFVDMVLYLKLNDDGSLFYGAVNGEEYSSDIVMTIKKQKKEFLIDWLSRKAEEINQVIEDILNIHMLTSSPEAKIRYEIRPFLEPEPVRSEVIKPKLKNTGLLTWLFKSFAIKVEEFNRNALMDYEMRKEKAEKDHAIHNKLWNEAKAAFIKEEERKKWIVDQGRFSNKEAMEEFLDNSFNFIEWPRETNINYEINDALDTLAIDVDLPEIEDLPSSKAKVAEREFSIKYRDISETELRKEYMKHIHGVCFRVIGEAFAALPTITHITLSAFSQRASKVDGNVNNEYLVSLKVQRGDWGKINFNNLSTLDLTECLASFELRRKMTKTGMFSPIEAF